MQTKVIQKKSSKIKLSYVLGLLFSTVPPIAATLSYFPLWHTRGAGAVISGGVLLLLLMSLLPLIRILRDKLRSPAAYLIWLAAFLFFACLSAIADELTVICFTGFLGNLIGAIFFALAKKGVRHDECGE